MITPKIVLSKIGYPERWQIKTNSSSVIEGIITGREAYKVDTFVKINVHQAT